MLTRTATSALAAAIVLMGAALPAAHAADTQTRSLTVSYNDLDVTTEAGKAALKSRIAHAAKSVCGDVDYRRLTDVQAAETCRTQALIDAVRTFKVIVAEAEHSKQVAQSPDASAN